MRGCFRAEIFKFINPIHRIIPDIYIMQSSISASDALSNYRKPNNKRIILAWYNSVKLLLYVKIKLINCLKNQTTKIHILFDYRITLWEENTPISNWQIVDIARSRKVSILINRIRFSIRNTTIERIEKISRWNIIEGDGGPSGACNRNEDYR